MEGVIKMDALQWIAQYWINWACALIAGGVIAFAKHYIKIQKEALDKKWQEKEKNMCGKIICTFENNLDEVRKKSSEREASIRNDLTNMHDELVKKDTEIKKNIDTLQDGILSIQGKQFRELCKDLLKKDYITIEEYEDFEAEYAVYKSLGGNHRGDALHERVVKKCDKQKNKPEEDEDE